MYDDAATATVSVPGDRSARPGRRSSILKLPRAPLDEVDQNYVTEPIPRSKPAKRVSFSFTTDIKIYDRDILQGGEADAASRDSAGNRAAAQVEVPQLTTAGSNKTEDIISGLLSLPVKQNEAGASTQNMCETTEKPPEAKPSAMPFLASLRSLTAKEPEDAMALTMVGEDRGGSLYKTAIQDVPMSITSCVNNEGLEQENPSPATSDVEQTCLNKSFGLFQVPSEEEETDNEKENINHEVLKAGLENDSNGNRVSTSTMLQECQCDKKRRANRDVVPLEGISPIHVAQKLRKALSGTGGQALCHMCGCRRQLLESTRIEETENIAAIMAANGSAKEQCSFQPSPEPSLNKLSPVAHKENGLQRTTDEPAEVNLAKEQRSTTAEQTALPLHQAGTEMSNEELNAMEITHCAPGTDVSVQDRAPVPRDFITAGPGNTGLVPAFADLSLESPDTHDNGSTMQSTRNVGKIHVQDDVCPLYPTQPVVEGTELQPLPSHTCTENEMYHPAEPEKRVTLEQLSEEHDVPVGEQTQAENLLLTREDCAITKIVGNLSCNSAGIHTEARRDENGTSQEKSLVAAVSAMALTFVPDGVCSDVNSKCTPLCTTQEQDTEKTETDKASKEADAALPVCFPQNDSRMLPVEQFSVPEVCLNSSEGTCPARVPAAASTELTSTHQMQPTVENPSCQKNDEDIEQAEAYQSQCKAETTCFQPNKTEQTLPVGSPNRNGGASSPRSVVLEGLELPAAFQGEHTVEKLECREQHENVEDMETDETDRRARATTGSTMQLTCFQHGETEKTPAMGLVTLHCLNEGASLCSTNVLRYSELEFTCQKENPEGQSQHWGITNRESDEADRQVEASLGSTMHLTCFQHTGKVPSLVLSLKGDESRYRSKDDRDVDLQTTDTGIRAGCMPALIPAERLPPYPEADPQHVMELCPPQSPRKKAVSRVAVCAGLEGHDSAIVQQHTDLLTVAVAEGARRELTSSALRSSEKDSERRPGSSSFKKAPVSSSKKSHSQSFGSVDAFRHVGRPPDGSASKGSHGARLVQRALFGEVAKSAVPPSPFILTPNKTLKDENMMCTETSQSCPDPTPVMAPSDCAAVTTDDHIPDGCQVPPASDMEVEHMEVEQPQLTVACDSMVGNESTPSFCDTPFREEAKHSALSSTFISRTTSKEIRQRKSATFCVQRPDSAARITSSVETVPEALSRQRKSATFCIASNQSGHVVCDVAAAASFVSRKEAPDIFSSPLHKVARPAPKADKLRTPTRIGWDYSKAPAGGGSEQTEAGAPGDARRTPVKMMPRVGARHGRAHNLNQPGPSSALKVSGSSSKKTRLQASRKAGGTPSVEPVKGAVTSTPMKAKLRSAGGGTAMQSGGTQSTESRRPGKHSRKMTPETAKNGTVLHARKVAKLLSSKKKVIDNVPEERARKQSPTLHLYHIVSPGEALCLSARKPATTGPSAADATRAAAAAEESSMTQSRDSDSLLSGVLELPEISICTATLTDIERYAELGLVAGTKELLEKMKGPTPQQLLDQLYWTLPSVPWEEREYVTEHLSEESATFLFLSDRMVLTVKLGDLVATRNDGRRCRQVTAMELRSTPLSNPWSQFLHKMFLRKANTERLSDMCRTTDYLANVLVELNKVAAECRLFVKDFSMATRRCLHVFEEDGNLRIQFLSISKGLWFYLTFKIDVETYPTAVMFPTMEIKHALTNFTLGKVNSILGQVPPGQMYLSRMENALHDWLE